MNTIEQATFASGCFWCTEAIFKRVRGVTSVIPGYSGGTIENPTYEQVSTGTTGHTECIQIEFNPEEISFSTLLEIFMHLHDPTTLNQQGNDIGTQYRSAIFYNSENQRKISLTFVEKLQKDNVFKNPIVTQVIAFTKFYPADTYHKNFYDNNRNYPYCNIIIKPKIRKLIQEHASNIKAEYKAN